MKVILIEPPWEGLYGRYKPMARIGLLYPPLGLCYLAAYIKNFGHQVEIIDSELQGFTISKLIEEIREKKPDIVGVRTISSEIDIVKNLCKRIKEESNLPIILGGPHVTILQEETFSDIDFNYGIYGEGEFTIIDLLEAIELKKDLRFVDGIIYKEDNAIIKTERRRILEDIDSLLFPDRNLLHNKKYLWSVPKRGLQNFTTILSTRGCPFECIFCSQDKMFGKHVRFRSAKNTVDEIEYCLKEFEISHFIFIDDNLTLDKNRILNICNEIRKRNLKITWEGWTHVKAIDEDIIKEMKDAGFVRISFGIESGNETILKYINKKNSLNEIRNAYRIAKGYGIETRGSVIYGLPGETRETVKETLNFVKNLKDLDQVYFNIAMPYPGTILREMALKGEMGIRLVTQNYSELRRHGNVVIEVNDLDKKFLLKFQRWSWLCFYLTPKRLIYNFFRAGIKAGIINSIAFIRSFLEL